MLGATAFTFDDDNTGRLFAQAQIVSLLLTSIWLGVILKRGNKTKLDNRLKKEAI